jgi:exodeoxyribonuclease-3
MLRVITANVNGIRSAAKKGFFEWLATTDADIICLQEVRASESQLDAPIYHPPEYHYQHNEAQKKGYSGVSLYSRIKPLKIESRIGCGIADTEGRYIHFEFPTCIVVSIYFPSGTSGEGRQAIKYQFLDNIFDYFHNLAKCSQKSLIICGDVNIAHTKKDIKNWQSNQKTSGFLPEERAWLDKVFNNTFVDAFRVLNQEPDQYTWWSHRARAFERNVGWRIDYQIITQDLADKIQRVEIYKDQKFSDHAPLIIDYTI